MGTRTLETAGDVFRNTLEPALHEIRTLDSHPICAAGVETYSEKVNIQREQIDRDRVCDDFCKWHPAFLTPKEHVEMGIMADQREWHAEQAARRDAWEAEQARLSDARNLDAQKKADERHAEHIKMIKDAAWTRFAGLLIAAAIGAIATYFARR